MDDASGTTPRKGWQLAALWAVGVSGAVVLSSAVVLGAAGRVTDPVTTFRLAAGPDGVTAAAGLADPATSAAPQRWPDLESFRIELATGSLLPRSAPMTGDWTDPATLEPTTVDDVTAGNTATNETSTSTPPATSTTGDQGTDSRPAGGSGHEPEPETGGTSQTISTDAGTVRVKVDGDRVKVVYATPNEGYSVTVDGDDTGDLEVNLSSRDGSTRINAGISGGAPSITVEQDSASVGLVTD